MLKSSKGLDFELRVTDLHARHSHEFPVDGRRRVHPSKYFSLRDPRENKRLVEESDLVAITGSATASATIDELPSWSASAMITVIDGPSTSFLLGEYFSEKKRDRLRCVLPISFRDAMASWKLICDYSNVFEGILRSSGLAEQVAISSISLDKSALIGQ